MVRLPRTLRTPLLGLAVFASLLVIPSAVSGCTSDSPFAKRNCEINDNPRVSDNRVVTVAAVNYIYSQEISGIYRDSSKGQLNAAYEEVNRIFRENHVNIQVVSLAVFDRTNVTALNIVTFPPIGVMVEQQEGLVTLIGVHWSEWRLMVDSLRYGSWASAPCPGEQCNWMNLAGALHNANSVAERGSLLARTFGFYFNLDIVANQSNLMCQWIPCAGTDLTIAQVNTMRDAINIGRTSLDSITCDPPAAPAADFPQIKRGPAPSSSYTGEPKVRGG